MKILIDAQCMQTEARLRGMGRYTRALIKSILELDPSNEYIFAFNGKRLEHSVEFVTEIRDLSKNAEFVVYDYPSYEVGKRSQIENIANVNRLSRYLSARPDIVHVSSIFEGESVWGPIPSFGSLPEFCGALSSVTLYDLIPHLFPEKYLPNPTVKKWYREILRRLSTFDIGLCISEATLNDAKSCIGGDLLYRNIKGGVDSHFRKLSDFEIDSQRKTSKFPIDVPFILYVGGPDDRKNVGGTLQAYAALPAHLQANVRLFIVYDATQSELDAIYTTAKQLGIFENIVVTGFVSDSELVFLYNSCLVFLFPSLYEGLGLPIIEAAACGAPVLVAANSSMLEIVEDASLRFDAASPKAIADKLEHFLTDPEFRRNAIDYSTGISERFTWRKSAEETLSAWTNAYEGKHAKSGSASQYRQKRVAIFSPLPPQQSGIASYTLEYVQVISKLCAVDLIVEHSENHVGLELPANVRIVHHEDFVRNRSTYAGVVYQVGNSPFHRYMLPYLKKYQGVAVIHDAFMAYLYFGNESKESFTERLIRYHGSKGHAFLSLGSDDLSFLGKAPDFLPFCQEIVYDCSGIIVHSEACKKILTDNCVLSAMPEVRVIPQFKQLSRRLADADRGRAKQDLDLPHDSFVIASFGHISPTKGILELIDGFEALSQSVSSAILVFVGKMDGGVYGQRVSEKIGNSPVAHRIFVTDYLSDRDYERYISVSDIAVQLRSISRGETSRGVLDALAGGVPLVTNRLGWTAELPANVAFFVDIDPGAIYDALKDIYESDTRRAQLSVSAIDYVRVSLNPAIICEQFLAAIDNFEARRSEFSHATAVSQLSYFADGDDDIIQEASTTYIKTMLSTRPGRTLIDCTHVAERDLGTGVQRVVKQIGKQLYQSDTASEFVEFVSFENDGIYVDPKFTHSVIGKAVPSHENQKRLIEPRYFDKALLADGTWHLTDRYIKLLADLRRRGTSVYCLIHDLLPFQNPQFFPDHVRLSLSHWIEEIAVKSDGVILTTHHSADLFIALAKDSGFPLEGHLRIGVVPLGSDFAGEEATPEPPEHFLVVGTIEPRKGHAVVLDAFQQLWESGSKEKLIFAGRRGWMSDDVLERIDNYDKRNDFFEFVEDANDFEIARLYRKAKGVIVPSVAEGFGLPLVEAIRNGRPVIASNLPVFNEIAGDDATFFMPGDSADLARAVVQSLSTISTLRSEVPSNPYVISWQESAKLVQKFMHGGNTLMKI